MGRWQDRRCPLDRGRRMTEPPIDPRAMLAVAERGARSVLRSRPDIDDAVQDACLRAVSRFQVGVHLGDAEAWMFRVAQNCARRLLDRERRYRGSKVEVEELASAGVEGVGGEVLDLAAQGALEVLQVYGHMLTRRQREVVGAAIEPGVSMREAARRFGTDSSTFRRDLLRAALRIRSRMAPPQDP